MNELQWKYADHRRVFHSQIKNGVPFLSFRVLEESGMTVDGFSTRLGGVSQGKWGEMNFSYGRGDNPEHVLENYTRMAEALGVDRDKMVVSWQTHTTNVRLVTKEDQGKGVIKPRDYRDVDGLICSEPGITLVTFYADCVPLYFLDKKNRAIGLSHSGWRGTVNRMGAVTLKAMEEAFGTKPEEVTACIGPSICQDCFEVGEDVVEAFSQAFSSMYWDQLWKKGRPGKYQLNLWKANEVILTEAGVSAENIAVTNLCTKCNRKYLFSHRADGENRGTLAAFFGLR